VSNIATVRAGEGSEAKASEKHAQRANGAKTQKEGLEVNEAKKKMRQQALSPCDEGLTLV